MYFPHPSAGTLCIEPSTPSGAPNCSTDQTYEQYGYDANSNRTSLRKRSGQTINYTYDVLNRETLKDIPGGARPKMSIPATTAPAARSGSASAAPRGRASITGTTQPSA